MTRIVVVTSGKGGVGKTTTSASFSAGLAMRGHKTAVIDFDVGLRNLDLIMGCERRVVYDFVNVIQGEATLNQMCIRDSDQAVQHGAGRHGAQHLGLGDRAIDDEGPVSYTHLDVYKRQKKEGSIEPVKM